jgi:hypothetical protein
MDISLQKNHKVKSKLCKNYSYDDVTQIGVVTLLGCQYEVDTVCFSQKQIDDNKF